MYKGESSHTVLALPHSTKHTVALKGPRWLGRKNSPTPIYYIALTCINTYSFLPVMRLSVERPPLISRAQSRNIFRVIFNAVLCRGPHASSLIRVKIVMQCNNKSVRRRRVVSCDSVADNFILLALVLQNCHGLPFDHARTHAANVIKLPHFLTFHAHDSL